MKTVFYFFAIVGYSSIVFGYTAPSPLKNIGIESNVSFEKQEGTYKYAYKIQNPSENNLNVRAVSIFIDFDPQKEIQLSSPSVDQCPKFHRLTVSVLQERPMVPVSSDGPAKWSCSYQTLYQETRGSFGWGAPDDPDTLKPGNSLGGFALTSYGLPGIREIQVRPDLNPTLLPPEYAGDVEKQAALKESTRWSGKTVGPVAPPLHFVASAAIDNIIRLANQSSDLGWIIQGKEEKKDKSAKKDPGILNSLIEKLDHAKLEISKNKPREALGTLRALVHEVDALYKTNQDKSSGKKNEPKDDKLHSHLTSEAYALIKYNTEYVIDQISKTIPKENQDKDKDKK